MTYRIRKAWTGKLVLQQKVGDAWKDADDIDPRPLQPLHMLPEFEIVHPALLLSLESRVAKADRNAAASRKGRTAKKITATNTGDPQ